MMSRKTVYICDGCGQEHHSGAPRLRLLMNRCDAELTFVVEGKRIEAIPCDGELHFCGPDCLKAYFEGLIGKIEER